MTLLLVQNGAFVIEQLTLLPAQSDAYVYRMYNFGGRCNLSPCTGTNDIIFGIEAHAYTKATHILCVNIVLPRGSTFPILCYLWIYMRKSVKSVNNAWNCFEAGA
jgi:hypothetical protein